MKISWRFLNSTSALLVVLGVLFAPGVQAFTDLENPPDLNRTLSDYESAELDEAVQAAMAAGVESTYLAGLIRGDLGIHGGAGPSRVRVQPNVAC